MPTPSERTALVFFAAVALLGAAVRFHRASADEQRPPPAARVALERQIAAVDDARELARSSRTRRARRRSARDTANAISSAPPSSHDVRPSTLLDLDTAPAESLERLPRIGPALAKRIVADRDSLGPFGSLDGFQRVKGVGPAMVRALAPYVTFSGTPRPSPVGARVSTRRRVSSRETRETRTPP